MKFKTRDEELDHTPLDFGKHNGKTPSEIAEIDPKYVIWMYHEFDNQPCSKVLYNACVEAEEDDPTHNEDYPRFR